jgi:hypothetical protein
VVRAKPGFGDFLVISFGKDLIVISKNERVTLKRARGIIRIMFIRWRVYL